MDMPRKHQECFSRPAPVRVVQIVGGEFSGLFCGSFDEAAAYVDGGFVGLVSDPRQPAVASSLPFC